MHTQINFHKLLSASSEPSESCVEGKEHSFKTVMHADSKESFTWVYRCTNCEEYVKKTQRRSGKSRAYWD